MSTLILRTDNEALQAALSCAINHEDPTHIIHIEGIPFAIQQLHTEHAPYHIESLQVSQYMPESSKMTVELQAAFAPYSEDEIRFGDTVYFVDNGTDTAYTVIGQSTHGHTRTGEPMMIVERQEKASKVTRVRKSLLTKTKPLIVKNGEIWECEAFTMTNESIGKRVLYRINCKWHYSLEGGITACQVKPIRKLGEAE